ncbi:hypothetical protein [Rhodococcus globerulus]|uniref:hypothetical protein n=1 Tax=Rhodococcus globerulus TaxID=33008 RepID=UPI001C5799AB|nr:hypothetical protein [Rhodococcus globerulus]QXW04371.1 hypothetical protein KYT97_10295 [Rhodococcus globerulus]
MRRLLTTLLIPVAILVTSCSSDGETEAPSATTVTSAANSSVSSVPAVPRTEPAFLDGCSAVSVYVTQQTQSGGAPADAAADFLKIVENDPSYQAMPEADKQLFREGIEAGAAGNC